MLNWVNEVISDIAMFCEDYLFLGGEEVYFLLLFLFLMIVFSVIVSILAFVVYLVLPRKIKIKIIRFFKKLDREDW